MNPTTSGQAATCVRCRQALPKDVSFFASCGFDNGDFERMGKWATVDQRIEEHLAWFRFKQFLKRYILWWLIR
jgi:hypothetical protein